jgi:hypothetical protein
MPNHAKDTGPKTTIWEAGADSVTLVKTILGLPYGTPKNGELIHVPGIGKARCSGRTTSGTGTNKTVVEVMFTLEK